VAWKSPRLGEVVVDQVGHDLGVGLRLEGVAERLQARALLLVVLDDPVVDRAISSLETWGCALGSVTPPWVAQRVWAMPTMPLEALGTRGALHLGDPADPPHAADPFAEDRDSRES
jgi:hypothetical protein